ADSQRRGPLSSLAVVMGGDTRRRGDKRVAPPGCRSRRSRCNRPVQHPSRPPPAARQQWPGRFRRGPALLSGPYRSTCGGRCDSSLTPLFPSRVLLALHSTLAFFSECFSFRVAFPAPLAASRVILFSLFPQPLVMLEVRISEGVRAGAQLCS